MPATTHGPCAAVKVAVARRIPIVSTASCAQEFHQRSSALSLLCAYEKVTSANTVLSAATTWRAQSPTTKNGPREHCLPREIGAKILSELPQVDVGGRALQERPHVAANANFRTTRKLEDPVDKNIACTSAVT